MLQVKRHVVETTAVDKVSLVMIDHEQASDERPVFQVKTYKKLTYSQGEDVWNSMFKIVNLFFQTLTEQQQWTIYCFYRSAYDTLKDEASAESTNINLSDLFQIMSNEVDLPQRIYEFVTQYPLVFPDLSDIGNRPQDREELTFREHDYMLLSGLSLLSKIMCPIWGDFIQRSRDQINKHYKEMYCLRQIYGVFDHPVFQHLHRKLSNYIENVNINSSSRYTRTQTNSFGDLGFTIAHAGMGQDRVHEYVYATIIVKKLALYDPLKDDDIPDIMKYVDVNTRDTVNTCFNNLQKENKTMVRLTGDYGSDEQDKASCAENEAIASRVPLDYPVYIRSGVELMIPKLLEMYTIPESVYQDACVYYHRNLPEKNRYTDAITGVVTGDIIGGARGLDLLYLPQYLKLLVITQIYLIRSHSVQLAHLLTAHTNPTRKTVSVGAVDTRIHLTLTMSAEYRDCLTLFPNSLGKGRSIADHIQMLMEWVTSYPHINNLAPGVQELIQGDPVPKGTPFIYDDLIIRELCRFYITHFNTYG